jgi:hypothetical protein
VNTTSKPASIRQRASKEIALLTGFLFLGLVVLPIIIYQVGQSIFGTYGGAGFSDFFGTLSGKIRGGDTVAWFLIFSPYLGLQCLRLIAFAWRITGRRKGSS